MFEGMPVLYSCVGVLSTNTIDMYLLIPKNICFQFDKEESLQMLPLPECWLVCHLFPCLLHDWVIIHFHFINFFIYIFLLQISKLHLLIDAVTVSYDKFFFGDVGRETYDFFWSDFADWYVIFVQIDSHHIICCASICVI